MKYLTVNLKTSSIVITFLFCLLAVYSVNAQKVFAACATQPTDYGTATKTVNIPSTGTYRVWSRIMAPDTTNNSYLLEIDGGSCITVGDSAISANTWTWVDYQSGSTTTKINISLTAGNHTFKMIGREAGVSLDRVIFTADLTCVPTGFGDNCASPPDTTLPTVNITSPSSGASITGSTQLTATASDDVAVTKVEFLVDGTIVNSDSSSPYAYTWNSALVADGAHTITAKAYDAAANTKVSSAVNITVSNTVPAPKPGDVNGDGAVNVFDLSILATNYGLSGKTRAQGDLNGDTIVNVFDLSIIAANWGL